MTRYDDATRWGREHRGLLAGVLLLLLGLAALLIGRRDGAPGPETVGAVHATTAVVPIEPFTVSVSALGVVGARPGAMARLSAPAATRVTAVLVATGDAVAAGQALVRLDADVFSAQERQARIALDVAQKAFERASDLVAQGIAPRKDEEAAAADVASARAALSDARRTLRLATLRSPIGGVVTNVSAAVAQPVDAGAVLVEVVDPRALEVVFHLSPGEASSVETGDAVELETAAPPASTETSATAVGSGTITGVSAAVDSATGTVAARARLDVRTRALRVGESVAGRIAVRTIEAAVVVPTSALVPDEDGVHVFVVDAEGVAHRTPVTVGARSDGSAQIVAGLAGGERVVTDGAYGVADGATVESAPPR